MSALTVALSVLGLLAVAIVGVYLAAVLDLVLGGLVAAARPRLGSALLLPLRSAAGLALQSRTTTERPDLEAWLLGPALLAALAGVALASVPLTAGVVAAGIDNGIVLFGAAAALVVVAVFLQGWSPNSPLPLIGGYRFIAEGLSYEIPLAVVLIAAALPARSLAIDEIVLSQESLWNVVRQPLGLPIYLAAGLGLAFWGPLALPEGEDVGGGSSLEASGLGLVLWRVAQYEVLLAVAAMGAAVFLGGWLGPVLPGALWMLLKTALLLVLLIATKHIVARVPTELYVVVSWAIIIPLALLHVFLAGLQALAAV
jgi:NADH-quinone oxidoreductase subunit H